MSRVTAISSEDSPAALDRFIWFNQKEIEIAVDAKQLSSTMEFKKQVWLACGWH